MMSFNFDKLIKESKKSFDEKKSSGLLGVVVLSNQGGGKSSVLGTFGVKTLFLYGGGEEHGPIQAENRAALTGGEIVPVCYEVYDEQGKVDPNKSLKRLNDLLDSKEKLKEQGFGAIVIDSATELENVLITTDFHKNSCLTDKGKVNAFKVPEVTSLMFRDIITKLQRLQNEIGVHYGMSCILDVQELGDDGAIINSKPRLSGYSVSENLIMRFPDVLVVGEMVKGDKSAHRIQMMGGMSRVSTDEFKRVKKCINFKPRISGVTDYPDTIKADLREVIKLKKGEK